MASRSSLDLSEIQSSLAELDDLSIGEYGCGLEDLLLDDSPVAALRLQRLVGIVLKRPFAQSGPPVPGGETGARRSWPWSAEAPDSRADQARKEFAILNDLRMPGPWHEVSSVEKGLISWDQFKFDVEHERGLFKILILYIDDKLRKQEGRTLQEYLEAKESRRFEATLDLSTLIFDAAVTGPLSALLGIPALAVGVTLVGIQYGYRRMTDQNAERVGDAHA